MSCPPRGPGPVAPAVSPAIALAELEHRFDLGCNMLPTVVDYIVVVVVPLLPTCESVSETYQFSFLKPVQRGTTPQLSQCRALPNRCGSPRSTGDIPQHHNETCLRKIVGWNWSKAEPLGGHPLSTIWCEFYFFTTTSSDLVASILTSTVHTLCCDVGRLTLPVERPGGCGGAAPTLTRGSTITGVGLGGTGTVLNSILPPWKPLLSQAFRARRQRCWKSSFKRQNRAEYLATATTMESPKKASHLSRRQSTSPRQDDATRSLSFSNRCCWSRIYITPTCSFALPHSCVEWSWMIVAIFLSQLG
eukprot:m.47238 g.47238  ORF g.47238 m.47238 type:complete len:304 (-) comp8834_c0_seq1:1078-1989(-)